MPELYPEDQKKVEQYLSAPQHQVERERFRPLSLLAGLALILLILTLVSYFVASAQGLI